MAGTDVDTRLASVHRLLEDAQFEEARARAEAALAGLPASTDPLLIGSLQLALVQAELGCGRLSPKSALQCREALARVRGQVELESHVRLCALRLGLELPEFGDDARDSLIWLHERRRSLRPSQRARLIVLEAKAMRLAGIEQGDCEVLRRGVAELMGTPEQRVIRLEHARARLMHGLAVDDLDELLLEVIEHDSSRDEIGLAEAIAWDHHDHLREPTAVRVTEWARNPAPHLCGWLLAQRGKVEEALVVLRSGVHAASEHVRHACAHALLKLLPDDAAAERLRHAEQLEAYLDRGDHPATRHDVAVAMRMVARANKDPELMERALANARRAAAGLANAGDHVGDEQVVGSLTELIGMRSTRPTADLAQLARQLIAPAPGVPSEMLANARAMAALSLTMMGPICHSGVIDVAETLVSLAEVDLPGHQGLGVLRARCRWLRGLQQGKRPEPGEWPEGPLDATPRWLIELTQGASVRVSPDELRVGLRLLRRVVDARPDVADHVLSCLIPAWEQARGPWVADLEVTLADCVEASPHVGDGSWPELRAAIDDALARDARPWLRMLSTTVARARRDRAVADAAPPDEPISALERARGLFLQGRHFSELARDASNPERNANSARARELMRAALEAAREAGNQLMEFHALVGLGNALRWGTEPDIEAALTCYREAEGLRVDDGEALAKLWKVEADALVERGRDEDLRRAEALIDRSLAIRKGRLRAETLLSASTVAERHPDLDDEERLVRSINFLMDAVRADRDIGRAAVPHLCEQLAQLRRASPAGHGVDDRLAELERRYPEQRIHIERARHGVGEQLEEGLVETMAHVMVDPDAIAVFRVRSMLVDPDEQIAQMPQSMLRQLSQDDIRRNLVERCIRGKPDRLEEELGALRRETSPEGAVGRLVAGVILLAELVRLGCREESDARRTTASARDAIGTLPSPRTRMLLLMMLAEVWQAYDGSNTAPMNDIDLSRELAGAAVEAVGGEQHALSDVVVLLARSHRYARKGDRNQHLRTARDIYGRLHDRARASGDGDLAAVALNHQVDAEMEMAVGDRRERLCDGIHKLRFALGLAHAPRRVAEIQISLAWYMTSLANFVGDDERRALLDEALSVFNAVDRNAAPSICNLDNLRSVCVAARTRVCDGPEAEVDFWEAKLTDPSLSAYDRAVFQHNLAIRLCRSNVTPARLHRALDLFEAAARVREPVSARHAWETCVEAGSMIIGALRHEGGLAPELLPWPRCSSKFMPWNPTTSPRSPRWTRRGVGSKLSPTRSPSPSCSLDPWRSACSCASAKPESDGSEFSVCPEARRRGTRISSPNSSSP